MDILKFKQEIKILKTFFKYFCEKKHSEKNYYYFSIFYKNEQIPIEIDLCKKCLDKLNYSIKKLQECTYENKPRCRKCATPCYEKKEWKELSKIMRYSAINLKINSLKNKINL